MVVHNEKIDSVDVIAGDYVLQKISVVRETNEVEEIVDTIDVENQNSIQLSIRRGINVIARERF